MTKHSEEMSSMFLLTAYDVMSLGTFRQDYCSKWPDVHMYMIVCGFLFPCFSFSCSQLLSILA